jgi:hypothetical protein
MNQFVTVAPSAADLNNQPVTLNVAAPDAVQQPHQSHQSDLTTANPTLMPIVQEAPTLQEVPGAKKKSMRHELMMLFSETLSSIEAKACAPVNAKLSEKYQGTFETRFNMPNEVAAKTVNMLAANGAIFYEPNANSAFAHFEKLRNAGGEINLSALTGRAKRPAGIDEASWRKLIAMRDEVSITLYNEGLAPIHALITQALAMHGLGGPKINKKLLATNLPDMSDKHTAMCAALKQLTEMLTA